MKGRAKKVREEKETGHEFVNKEDHSAKDRNKTCRKRTHNTGLYYHEGKKNHMNR